MDTELAVDHPNQQILVGICFDDTFRAQEFLTAVSRMAANKQIRLRDAVMVVKDHNGRTVVKETQDPQPGPSAFSGALWAGLFGLLLGGPVGWVAGAALGAGAGAVTAKVVDLGISDEWVGWFREAVEPGKAVLAILAEDLDRTAMVRELERFHGARLVYANVDGDWEARMRRALGEPAPATPPPATPAD
jgi:uncharacterized membrane protein